MIKLNRFLAIVVIVLLVLPLSAQDRLTLTPLDTYQHGGFDEGAAEIAAYDAGSQRVFVTNAELATIDILDMSVPSNLSLFAQIDISDLGESVNSVAAFDGLVAAAIQVEEVDGNGVVAFYDVDGNLLTTVEVGVLPDMVTFTPDGSKVLTANEGEPNDDYTIDPLGSITIIDVSDGVESATSTTVTFEGVDIPDNVRIYGPNATPAQDLEPEYIAISPDGTTAYISLQENNALGILDIESATITAVVGLGFKDHSLAGNELDAGKDDGIINITNWPVLGMYQPDGIATYEVDGEVYIVTANEGDTRDYDGYSEEGEIGESAIDEAFPNLATLSTEAGILGLGLVVSTGDNDADGDLDSLYIPGARSFSIWAADGTLVWDSGAQFEEITAEALPDDFNSTNDENDDFDGRSDNKGPEPESVTIGFIDGVTYAFIVLERIGGVMIYDITDPTAPSFVNYSNNRDFNGDAEAGTAGDLAPESSVFISAMDSPTGTNLLIVTNEVSGTTTVFEISQ